tara:strand:- start:580 stop:720 length:141 start_codon:yes stop_codon:yes gene_type:complete
MKTKSNEEEHEICPLCEMPLEDSEECSYCTWTRNNTRNKGEDLNNE